ncbi:MAG: hypothetical protein H0W25_01390 [Acidimicrobiia bacterium]|nr:hypothetical protein [Acidimicrobiia bacterium]
MSDGSGGAGGHPSGPRTVAKPDELLALHDVAGELFELLRSWFDVPASVPLDLSAVDAAVRELGDPQMIAALAMRKLQALHLLATPGVRTTTDVVVTIIQDLQRALLQAPRMRLQVKAAAVDWDAELAGLDDLEPDDAPAEASGRDAELDRFRELHRRVNAAVVAVVEAGDGEIVILV